MSEIKTTPVTVATAEVAARLALLEALTIAAGRTRSSSSDVDASAEAGICSHLAGAYRDLCTGVGYTIAEKDKYPA